MSNDNVPQGFWTHGHHLEIEHPDRATNILRRGRSLLVEGISGKHTWLHGTISTPVEGSSDRIRAWIRSRSSGGAEITAIHVWDGDRRIGRIDNLRVSSQEWISTPLAICLTDPLRWGIGVSVRVSFASAGSSSIEISAIGCELKVDCLKTPERHDQLVVASERFPVRGNVATLNLPFVSQFKECAGHFFTYNPAVRRIAFSFHGVGANANLYCWRMADAASPDKANATEDTLIIAPQFLNLYDPREPVVDIEAVLGGEGDLIYWRGGRFVGRRSANDPAYPREERISSFTAIDQMLQHCIESALFPNLEAIVLVGQSGGGQFLNRYAASSIFEPPNNVHIRYIPMNPGAYVYLSNKRQHTQTSHPIPADSPMSFKVPDDAALEYVMTWAHGGSLPSENFNLEAEKAELLKRYNNYDLGVAELMVNNLPYHKEAYQNQDEAVNRMRENYQKRAIVHLVGTLDNEEEPDQAEPRNSYALALQGRSRLERARVYARHLKDEGLWSSSNHVLCEVEDVGHNGHAMMISDDGLWYIFGHGTQPTAPVYIEELDQLKREVWMIMRFLERMYLRRPVPGDGLPRSVSEREYAAELERATLELHRLRKAIERHTGRYP